MNLDPKGRVEQKQKGQEVKKKCHQETARKQI